MQPARITDRFLAYLLDVAPFAAGYAFRQRGWMWLGLYLAYQAAGNLSGATLGKRLLGIRVVDLQGNRLGFGPSVLRALGMLASTPLFNLGFLWSFLHPQSRTWHDLMAGSLVVEARPKSQAALLGSAMASLAALVVIVWSAFWLSARTPSDLQALSKARQGLAVLARMEEQYKAAHGGYTDRLADLARESGDVRSFKESLSALFDPDGFRFYADKGRYRLSARALDRRRTTVTLSGPNN